MTEAAWRPRRTPSAPTTHTHDPATVEAVARGLAQHVNPLPWDDLPADRKIRAEWVRQGVCQPDTPTKDELRQAADDTLTALRSLGWAPPTAPAPTGAASDASPDAHHSTLGDLGTPCEQTPEAGAGNVPAELARLSVAARTIACPVCNSGSLIETGRQGWACSDCGSVVNVSAYAERLFGRDSDTPDLGSPSPDAASIRREALEEGLPADMAQMIASIPAGAIGKALRATRTPATIRREALEEAARVAEVKSAGLRAAQGGRPGYNPAADAYDFIAKYLRALASQEPTNG